MPLFLSLSNPIFSRKKVCEVLLNLNSRKEQGSDGIPARLPKEFDEELPPVFSHIFHLLSSSQCYPSTWKHSLCQPDSKKGDKSDLFDNCPFSRHLSKNHSISKVVDNSTSAPFSISSGGPQGTVLSPTFFFSSLTTCSIQL